MQFRHDGCLPPGDTRRETRERRGCPPIRRLRIASEPFEGIEKSFSDDDDRVDYIRFWEEYDHLLRLAEN